MNGAVSKTVKGREALRGFESLPLRQFPEIQDFLLQADSGFARENVRAGLLRDNMENRIRECPGDLFADRTSTAIMRASLTKMP